MNFIQFSFSNAYIYSPMTWLHKMRANDKIFIIFIVLFLIPYLSFSCLLVIALSSFIIILTLKFRQNYYYSCFSILFATFICLLPYCFSHINYLTYNTVKIYTPHQIFNLFINIKYKSLRQSIITYEKTWIQLKIPAFMIKTVLITILYSIILKTLFLTTMHEQIILSLCIYIKINNYYLKQIIFISSFASQFLEQMTKHIRVLYISVKLRHTNLIICTNKFSVCYYIIVKFLNYLKSEIQNVSSVLYSREFSDQNFKISNL